MDAIYVLYHRPRHVLYLCHQYATMLLAYGLSSALIGSISGVIFSRRGEVRSAFWSFNVLTRRRDLT